MRASESQERAGRDLFKASQRGDVEKVKELIDSEAPVDWQNVNGDTPLHIASSLGNTPVVKKLIESKADVNITNRRGKTPLIFAARNNHFHIVHELVWSGCDIKVGNGESKNAAEQANYGKGTGLITEYLTKEALREQVNLSFRGEQRHEENFWSMHMECVVDKFAMRFHISRSTLRF